MMEEKIKREQMKPIAERPLGEKMNNPRLLLSLSFYYFFFFEGDGEDVHQNLTGKESSVLHNWTKILQAVKPFFRFWPQRRAWHQRSRHSAQLSTPHSSCRPGEKKTQTTRNMGHWSVQRKDPDTNSVCVTWLRRNGRVKLMYNCQAAFGWRCARAHISCMKLTTSTYSVCGLFNVLNFRWQ